MGYTNFKYGLPGNQVPVRRDGYQEGRRDWSGGEKPDGFQIYENGGVTARYAYFTIQALYPLGRHAEADVKGGFQGGVANGRTYDLKAWNGTPYGYEACWQTATKRYWPYSPADAGSTSLDATGAGHALWRNSSLATPRAPSQG